MSSNAFRNKVLVVDDEPQVLSAIADTLEDEYLVVLQTSPEGALRVVENEPDLSVILSDQRMPGMSGDEFLARARVVSDASRLMITGYADLEAVVSAVNNGHIFGYISKPWDPRGLKLAIYKAAEHHRLMRELSEEQRLLHNLMDNIPDAIFFKDREHRFQRINKVHASILGVQRPEDAVGRPTSDFFPPGEARQRDAEDDEILRTGKPLPDKVRRISLPGGGFRWRSTTKAPIKGEKGQITGLVGIARDVTERQRLQEDLREREAGLRRAQLMAKLGHVITRPDGSFESWSETLPQLIGVDSAGMPQSTREWLNIVHPDNKQKFREKAIETGATGERFDLEYRLRRADGAWIDVRQVSEPMMPGEPDAEGRVRWFGTLQDVTEQKQAGQRISRLNRVYAVLSGINAAIVHTRDRQELFREVCRIAIDSGRFRMVWFGLLDKEGQRVMPVASAGDVRGFFDAASTAVTHAKPDGHGLTGRAIREMKPMVSNDIQNDPQRTMKEEFRERGINSLAVLPLIIGNEAVGVVNLYAADVGFFDEEEMRLLRELAGDISFALDNIDKQEKLRRLTRVNEMLSSINGAIVRIRDRLELYQEACRIAVETGGLRFAWLCVVDEDEMRLKPVASAGADDGYLDLIRGRLSLRDDAPEGHGIAARAVREKRVLVVNDAQSDPNVLFKKEHAARGIRSTAVLPLSVAGKVVGTFGLHSGEVGFFDDQETKLIDEIAGNIAFALDHIEKEEKVERLNRVYSVLSGINALIVRVRDRDELYREACRIAVEAGGFRFAWVGVVDREAMQLAPVAWAGVEQDFFAAVRTRLSLTESDAQGRSMVARAVLAREAMISNDVADDPRILFKQEHAERGIRSLAAFPLIVSGEVAGILALHAAELGFFDDEELRLLTELAGDISFALEHIEKTERLDYLAYYDSLTGLANRSLFVERVTESLHSTRQTPRRVALIVADIERFRTINDSLGRQAGDLLLKQAAERLRSNVPVPTHVARLVGDHFAILLPEAKAESDVARWLEQLMRKWLGEPFRIGDTELRISAKAGIALSAVDGGDADMLFKQAEAALENAKRTGEPYLFFEQAMTDRVAGTLTLENQLRGALEREEFVLHYQPKVDLASRRIVGMEALIRWKPPDGGLVPPMKFIPLLEETGLILPVGAWAMRKAAQDHRELLRQGIAAPRVAVNVSAIQLRRRDFVATVKRAIEDGTSPPAIDLEITESLVMEGIAENIQKLSAVRDLGLQIAIDDFGTGYSSLAYLAKLPVHALKIDRSFIITMLDDPNVTTLVSTIISLARSLKLKVVAEGVDSEEQAKVLRLLRCDEMQGYLFSKPLPMDALVELLRKAS
jgi:diguanylate cyclase (GGDEF)-like protein/PAS domain S-box-containing protein